MEDQMPNNATNTFLRGLPMQAEKLAADPALMKAFSAALGDFDLREMALRRPSALLQKFSVKLPLGLSVIFFEGHVPSMPYPFGDGWFPTIKLINCRTVWVRECKRPRKGLRLACRFYQEEFCFGFEIVPGQWLPPIAK
jgi:hypothetical protein